MGWPGKYCLASLSIFLRMEGVTGMKIRVVADGGSPKLAIGDTWYIVVQKGDKVREHRAEYDKVFEIDEELYNKAFEGNINKHTLAIGFRQGQWHIHLGGEDTGRTATEI